MNTTATEEQIVPVITSTELLKHWQGHRGLTRKVIDAFPEKELFEYSVGGMRPFAGMVQELLAIAVPGIKQIVGGEAEQLNEHIKEANSKANILSLWDKATADINTYWPQIVERIAAGVNTPDKILEGLKTDKLKARKQDLEKSLKGIFKPWYIKVLKQHLTAYHFFKKQMLAYETEIEATLKILLPSQAEQIAIEKKTVKVRKNQYHFNLKEYLHKIAGVDLTEIDGLDENTVLTIIAVVGLNMHKWPTAEHFTSWLNLSARPKKSGGKTIGHQRRFTNNSATQAFRMAAQTMWQQKGMLGHLYRRLSHTKGTKKAIKAVARRLAVIFYNMLKKQTAYDSKIVVLDEAKIKARKITRLQKEAEKLGCRIEILAA